MCGIVGIWDFKEEINKSLLEKMRDTLIHRGPDDAGIFIDNKNDFGIGHRRLAILDLTKAGHQPMDMNGLVIAYNGEIYNFKEIREELSSFGYRFVSTSDTEVVLKAFHKWGVGSINKFRGMFAFAIWDKEKRKVFLCRDRTGIKPLYYYFNDNMFVFASEIKAIIKHPKVKKEIDFDALSLYLQFGYIQAPYSIFKNIKKLEPGHILEMNKNKEIHISKYWDVLDYYLQENNSKKDLEEHEVETKLETILTESFKSRMVSDVEVGMFLSGGIDSSVVSAILAKKLGIKIKTFTIGFYEKKYNEANHARKIAKFLGTDHYEKYCTQKEAIEIIPKLPEIYDEPFGDSSSIPTYLVSKFARKYVKVSLSADGGDEIFGGYDRYWKTIELYKKINTYSVLTSAERLFLKNFSPEFLARVYKRLNFVLAKQTNLRNKFLKLKEILNEPKSFQNVYLKTRLSYWLPLEIDSLIKSKTHLADSFSKIFLRTNNLDFLSQMQAVDYKIYLTDDILTKVDRATMAVGLESREPLLDNKIIEFVSQLSPKLKYNKGVSKYILRKVLYKYVPKDFLERPKQGFGVPLDKWFKNDLKDLMLQYLNKKNIESGGIFNWEVVKNELDRYYLNDTSYVSRLWLILNFEIWKEKWM